MTPLAGYMDLGDRYLAACGCGMLFVFPSVEELSKAVLEHLHANPGHHMARCG